MIAPILLLALQAAAPSEADFTAETLARLRQAHPGLELATVPDEPLVIKRTGKDDGQINLHRLYSYCATATAEDCEASRRHFVETIGLPTPAVTAASLRLIVRDQEYFDYITQADPSESKARLAISKPIGGGLYALLASDAPDTIRLVGDDAVKELGLSSDQAWEMAARQTQAILPALPTGEQIGANAYAFQDSEYLGSLLADLAAWDKIASAAGPDLFVTVVSDHFVLVGKMPEGPGLDALKQTVAQDCAAQERCISPQVYRFRGGRWSIAD